MSEIKTQTKTIGGHSYSTTPFMALEALNLQNELLRIIVPSLGLLLGGVNNLSSIKGALNSQLNGMNIAEAVQILFSKLDQDTYLSLLKKILRNTTVTIAGDKPKMFSFGENTFDTTFNMAFPGQLLNIYLVIYFVLEVNFPDFFEKMKGFIGSPTEITAG
jgi:hypothetical protein